MWTWPIDPEASGSRRKLSNTSSTGRPISNLVGTLELRVPGNSHPETAKADFKSMLKRKKGFEFEVVGGRLREQEVTAPTSPFRVLKVHRAKVVIGVIAQGTDAAHELADFPSPRKTLLEVSLRDGTAVSIPLFLTRSGRK